MQRSVRRLLAGDAIIWFFAAMAAIIAATVSWLGHTPISQALLLGMVVVLVLFLGLRSLTKRRLLVSGVVLGLWLVAYAALVLLHAPREFAFVMVLVGAGAVAVLYIRKMEF